MSRQVGLTILAELQVTGKAACGLLRFAFEPELTHRIVPWQGSDIFVLVADVPWAKPVQPALRLNARRSHFCHGPEPDRAQFRRVYGTAASRGNPAVIFNAGVTQGN